MEVIKLKRLVVALVWLVGWYAVGRVDAFEESSYEEWLSSETSTAINHYVFTSSSVFVDGIVISSPGLVSTYALFDSSTVAKVDGNFIHVTTITTYAGAGAYAGQYVPVKKQFGLYGLMLHVIGSPPAQVRLLYRFYGGTYDASRGD